MNLKNIDRRIVLLSAMQNILLPRDYYRFIVVHRDNKDNLPVDHYLNLYYSFIQPLEHEVYKGYYYIPYYTRYLISKDAKIKSLASRFGKHKDKTHYSFRYTTIDLFRDFHFYYKTNNKITYAVYCKTGVHRLMGLTFLQYQSNPFDLEIDHKDCNKLNNNLNNLEWVTSGENNFRAYVNGLKQVNQSIRVYDYLLNKEMSYHSFNSAAASLNIAMESVRQAYLDYINRSNDIRLINGRYMVKDKRDVLSFPSREEVFDGSKVYTYKHLITVFNIITKEEKIFLGVVDVCEYLEKCCGEKVSEFIIDPILRKQIINKSISRPLYIYNIYTTLYSYDNLDRIKKYSDIEISFYKKLSQERNNDSKTVGYVLLNKSGEYLDVFTKIERLSEFLEVETKYLRSELFRNNGIGSLGGVLVSCKKGEYVVKKLYNKFSDLILNPNL